MAFGSRNKGRAQEARPRPRCSRAKKELRLRRRVPWLDLLCRSFFESISLGQILSLKRCSNQVELALPIDKKMIRSPNDSRDYRLVERFHGEDLFSGPVTFDRFTFSAQSIRSRRGSTTIYQAPLERRRFLCDHRSSPFLFLCFPVYRGFFLSFFLSEEEIVQKNRGFLYQYPSMLRLFLFIVPLFFFSFFYEFVPRCTHSAG